MKVKVTMVIVAEDKDLHHDASTPQGVADIKAEFYGLFKPDFPDRTIEVEAVP